MPRIEFDGQGAPIPTIALPPFGSDGDLPQTSLAYYVDDEFPAAQYRTVGFTHFEAWCVGGAGGRGGDVSNQLMYARESAQRAVPGDVWSLWLEQVRILDYITTGEWDHIYHTSGGGDATMVQIVESQNPGHLLVFVTYKQILLFPTIEAMGGGGGGGGFQKASGLLADLSDTVPVKVGQFGGDQGYGQTIANGLFVPPMDPSSVHFYPTPGSYPYPESRRQELANYFTSYLNSYPGAHSSYFPPLKGGDGGYSAFGDVCKASGGKGGAPGKAWDGSQFILKGDGGDGGVGGSIIAGGGGAGSISEGINGSDGGWVPETGIGEGGGGGKGGRASEFTGDPRFGVPTEVKHLATAGGQGSYSFGDTSVYGQRQFRGPWTYQKPVANNGAVTYVSTSDSSNLVTPGGGGGARPLGTIKAGSSAPVYSPNGVVILRLTKIT